MGRVGWRAAGPLASTRVGAPRAAKDGPRLRANAGAGGRVGSTNTDSCVGRAQGTRSFCLRSPLRLRPIPLLWGPVGSYRVRDARRAPSVAVTGSARRPGTTLGGLGTKGYRGSDQEPSFWEKQGVCRNFNEDAANRGEETDLTPTTGSRLRAKFSSNHSLRWVFGLETGHVRDRHGYYNRRLKDLYPPHGVLSTYTQVCTFVSHPTFSQKVRSLNPNDSFKTNQNTLSSEVVINY